MKSTTEYGYAKINLALDVTGVRDNGYHDVRMIMQSVDLHDTLKLTKTDAPGITLSVGTASLPAGPGNLVYDAAKLLFDRYDLPGGIYIELDKRIPMSAGLAGGSSDAAATLRGINRLFELGLSATELCNIGVTLGADIPYCVIGGTALAEGIGEIITPLPAMPGCRILLVKPPAGVSTGFVYKNRSDPAKQLYRRCLQTRKRSGDGHPRTLSGDRDHQRADAVPGRRRRSHERLRPDGLWHLPDEGSRLLCLHALPRRPLRQ